MLLQCCSDETTHLVQLEQDAADAPHVARLGPAQLQDHFRGLKIFLTFYKIFFAFHTNIFQKSQVSRNIIYPVVSGGDDRAVVLPVEGGRAEVDELDPGVAHAPDVALGGGAVLAVPVRAHEQDVLRLQVGVGQVVVVQKLKIKYLELRTSLISTYLRPLLSIYFTKD